MIDWQKASLQEFSLEVDAEGIQELGPSVVFPLKVYYRNETLAFVHPVTLRAEFYEQLMGLPDGRGQLRRIFQSRLREELARRRAAPRVSIEDKVRFIQNPAPLEG